jgi:DNA-binding response OmpR family regulator
MDRKKILIVDDDKDLLTALNLRLRSNNYNVVFANDGALALTIARKESPDLIILDIGLPGGDGFMVMNRLKTLSSLSNIPIIILTAKDPLVNQRRAVKAGAEAFLQKPVDNEQLLSTIERAL